MSNPLREQMHPTALGTIGVGGFIAGVLDITDAIVFYIEAREDLEGRGEAPLR